ncbi:MAG TPA: LysM peptidoglycan-binding domain-containing protein, partial [Anaerolineaceae bacterium]|nr:LysM peptidoglycan-binding domain-containing protein [Anaerolineaceae bacterium]
MYRKPWVFVLLSLALILALSACTRSASQPPAATPTSESDFPFPLPTNNPLQNILSGTQTAMAKSGLPVDQSTPAAPGATQDVAAQPTAGSVDVLPTATPAPTLPVATWVPTAGSPTTYTIQEGEYPFCLARRFNVDAGELLSANGLSMDSKPAAGTSIKIPSGGKPWAGDRARLTHP